METPTQSDATYALGRSAGEAERLQLQARVYDPFTRQIFVDAGITPGMKVLDVGCGTGDVAFLAADLVGPTGAVVGLDINPAFLETAGERAEASDRANVTFVEADLREAPVPDDFDAVVGRLVLIHLPNPAAGLRAACRHLRPGGVVAFDEGDTTEGLIAIPPSPEYARVAAWVRAGLGQAGVELGIAFRLRQIFAEAGLPEPHLHLYAPMGGGSEWIGYEYAAQTIRSMVPLLVRCGIATEEEIDVDTLADRLRREIVGQRGTVVLVHHVGACARKP